MVKMKMGCNIGKLKNKLLHLSQDHRKTLTDRGNKDENDRRWQTMASIKMDLISMWINLRMHQKKFKVLFGLLKFFSVIIISFPQ